MIDFLLGLICVTIATEAITEILASSKLLDIIGIRPWASRKALPFDGDYTKVRWYHTALHTLLTCGYCTSVWVSMFFSSWFVPGDYFGLLPWNNIIIKIFLIHRLSNLFHASLQLLMRGRVNTSDLSIKHSIEYSESNERTIHQGVGETGTPS